MAPMVLDLRGGQVVVVVDAVDLARVVGELKTLDGGEVLRACERGAKPARCQSRMSKQKMWINLRQIDRDGTWQVDGAPVETKKKRSQPWE